LADARGQARHRRLRRRALGPLTGARRVFGIAAFVDYEAGAYRFDHSAGRSWSMARERAARKYGVTFDRTSTVLIGDIPHDVAIVRRR
jgi:hypothetical protein